MPLVIAGLALLVIYLAVKSPDPNQASNSEPLGPNQSVPMLGSVGNPSPAMSGGSRMISQLQRTAMSVNAALTGATKATFAPVQSAVFNARAGTLNPPTQTVAEMSKTLMTQAPTALPLSLSRTTGSAGGTIKI